MWWAWPHLRRVWAAMGAVSVGLIVSYLYSLSSRQPLPDQRFIGHLLNDYWQWIGGGLIALAAVSGAAARAHRQHEVRAPQPLRIKPGGWRARRKRKSPEPVLVSSAPGSALMVGRGAELAQLQEFLAQIRKGQRRVVFVAGEPGIGKSTLVSAFSDAVTGDRDVRIVQGQCVEQYGAGEPYMPILDGLTRLCRAPGGERILAILHRLAPAWLAQMPSLVSAEDRVRLQGQSQGVTQQRMLREMAEALEAITAESPLVLLIEDLHWSDYSTLDLIGAIARRTEPARLMILGTYRPVEMLAGEHPLRALKAELELHQQCEELRLKLLSEGDVANYLHQRFASAVDSGIPLSAVQLADSTSPLTPLPNGEGNQNKDPGLGTIAQSAATIYARSEGNPLFMVNVVDYLVAQGPDFDASKLEAPHNLRQMIERNLERLTPEEQSVLEAASVAGAEFSAAAVAAALERTVPEIEACCTRLARREQFVGTKEPVSWPDGTVASGFRFHHALYRETLYGRLPAGHRVELHRRIAQREEAAFGERAGEIAAELAHQYSHANEKDNAVRFLQIAGEQAASRCAMVEAECHFRSAIEFLRQLPEDPERDRRERALQLAYGPTVIAVKGWASPETERAYSRAQELCDREGDSRAASHALFGLWVNHLVRSEFRVAFEIGEELLARAQRLNDPTLLLFAHQALGDTAYSLGELRLAKENLEKMIALCGGERQRALGVDMEVVARSYAASAIQLLGYPEQALRRAEEAVALARSLSDPFSVVFAHNFLIAIQLRRGEASAAQATAEREIALCVEHGFAYWRAHASVLRGGAFAAQGRGAEGLAQIKRGLEAVVATGGNPTREDFQYHKAVAYAEIDLLDDALSAVTDALAAGEKFDERVVEAEILRLKGELLLRRQAERNGAKQISPRGASGISDCDAAKVLHCFEQAIEVAQRQSAKFWELRATTSLARLLASRGNREEARTKLAEIYNWFTEGFDTADLKEAKALLDELN